MNHYQCYLFYAFPYFVPTLVSNKSILTDVLVSLVSLLGQDLIVDLLDGLEQFEGG